MFSQDHIDPEKAGSGWIRPGPGVVGRTTMVGLGALAVLAIAIVAARDYIWVVAGFVVVGFVGLVLLIREQFRYARQFPDHSIMEGGEYAQFYEAKLGAKHEEIIEGSAEPAANHSPPKQLIERSVKDGV